MVVARDQAHIAGTWNRARVTCDVGASAPESRMLSQLKKNYFYVLKFYFYGNRPLPGGPTHHWIGS